MSSGCCGGGKSAEKVQPASTVAKKAVPGKTDAGAGAQPEKQSEAACHSPDAKTGTDTRRGGCCG